MGEFTSLESGKRLDRFSGLLLGESQVIETLQIQPKLSARTEKMSKPQGGVTCDGPRSVQDLCDAISRHVDLTRQLSRTHIERLEFLSQVFARMDSRKCHSYPPSDSQQSPRLKLVAATPPKVTFVAPVRLMPVMVTFVPVGPMSGLKFVIWGITFAVAQRHALILQNGVSSYEIAKAIVHCERKIPISHFRATLTVQPGRWRRR
jgi:hypothetical protein